jgi:hypothetical protein
VIVLDIPLMSNAETIQWMRDRVNQFKAAIEGKPPPCTDEERWKQPGKDALMKQGRKTAVKLFDSVEEIGPVPQGHYIEERPTKFNRCEAYCNAAQWCPQHQAFLMERENVSAAEQPAAATA